MSNHPKATVFNYGLLRFLREDQGLSREDVRKRLAESGLEIHFNTLINWENGESSPDAKHLPKLAQVLGCEVEDFYRPTPAKPVSKA